MNISKIFKFYLILTLSLGTIAGLSYSDTVKSYYSTYSATVFNAFDDFDENATDDFFKKKPYAAAYTLEEFVAPSPNNFLRGNRNGRVVNFSITQDPEKRLVKPGTEGAEIMQFVFKTGKENLEFDRVNLKIVGVETHNIKRAYLFEGEKLLGKVSPSGEYLKFDNIDYQLKSNSTGVLAVRLDVSDKLMTHDRIRLDIENAEDLSLTVGGENYTLNEYYPIRGEYLSIVRPRVWGPNWGKDEKE